MRGYCGWAAVRTAKVRHWTGECVFRRQDYLEIYDSIKVNLVAKARN